MSNPAIDPRDPMHEVLQRDRRYRLAAYQFVLDALEYAQRKRYVVEADNDYDEQCAEENHVTGQELCEAIREYALELFGLTAKSVFEHWGIRSTADIGEIVFNMIDAGRMKKTDQDRREDFLDVFDFDEGLRQGFKITMPNSNEENWA